MGLRYSRRWAESHYQVPSIPLGILVSRKGANREASVQNKTVCYRALSHHLQEKGYGLGWVPLSILFGPGTQSRIANSVSMDVQEGRRAMQIHAKESFWLSTGLAAVALAGALIFMGAPSVRADEGACQRKIAKADHRIHEAAEHHGWQSRQVEEARHQLHEAREYCWSHAKRWWDEDDHRWHTDRDWDDHDHDRGRDRDHDRDHR